MQRLATSPSRPAGAPDALERELLKAQRVLRNIGSGLRHQFDLMLAATITLPHLLVSSEISVPKSAGDPERTMPARLASRDSNFGSAMLMLTSLFSLSISSAGVFLGASIPYHALASYSGKVSLTAGTSGSASDLVLVVTAK